MVAGASGISSRSSMLATNRKRGFFQKLRNNKPVILAEEGQEESDSVSPKLLLQEERLLASALGSIEANNLCREVTSGH